MIGDFGLEKITETELQEIMRRYAELVAARFAKAHEFVIDPTTLSGMTYMEAVAAEETWRDESNKLGIYFQSDDGELLGAWYGDTFFSYNLGDVNGQ